MNTNSTNSNKNNNSTNNNSKNNKKPAAPRAKSIPRSKYFRIGARDSIRIKNIKEGMNHLFDRRNKELEELFLQEATQYTERVLGETRKIQWTEEEDHEAMDVIFNNSVEDLFGEGLSAEDEIIDGQDEERLEKEAEESETDSEEVLALQERIEREDQEEYDRIRAEMEEEEAEANKNN